MSIGEFLTAIGVIIAGIGAYLGWLHRKKSEDFEKGKTAAELIRISNKISELSNNYDKMYENFKSKIEHIENKFEKDDTDINHNLSKFRQEIYNNLSKFKTECRQADKEINEKLFTISNLLSEVNTKISINVKDKLIDKK